GQSYWTANSKGASEGVPMIPKAVGAAGSESIHLLPGMNGTMQVQLKQFREAFLLPASAVFTRGGKTYILVVVEGVTKLVPVRVQVNDGVLAKVLLLEHTGGLDAARELTGSEEIVRSRQTEVGEGQAVTTTVEPW